MSKAYRGSAQSAPPNHCQPSPATFSSIQSLPRSAGGRIYTIEPWLVNSTSGISDAMGCLRRAGCSQRPDPNQPQPDRARRRLCAFSIEGRIWPASHKPAETSASTDTKKAAILALLRRPEGATIAAMRKATGWQPHSVRGFLSGHVRKKLGMAIQSEGAGAGRVYRFAANGGAKRGNRQTRAPPFANQRTDSPKSRGSRAVIQVLGRHGSFTHDGRQLSCIIRSRRGWRG
jgi:hypothetical protein